MKKEIKRLFIALLCMTMCISFAACAPKEEVSLWDTAVYTENTTLGEGEKTITLQVEAQERSITFIIRTNEEILENALVAHDLISGDEGPYGMYVTHVNGIKADYDENNSFWSLEKDGEQMTTGVSETGVSDGDNFKLVYVIV